MKSAWLPWNCWKPDSKCLHWKSDQILKKEAWIIQFNIDKYDKIFDNDKGVHFILFFWNPKTNSGWNKDDDDIISSVLSV